MKAGLNLYSIRNLIKTEEEFLSAAEKLKEIGYAYLQYSGGPYDPEAIKRVSEKTGMPVVLTHVPLERILYDADKLMEEHKIFNCRNIGLGTAINCDLIKDESKCKSLIEKLERAAEKMHDNGFKFFYHNHHFEFYRFRCGETIFDYMIKNTDYLNFTLDTYWVQYGGVNLIEYLNKLDGRIECVHLKDYRINSDFVPEFAPVGDGVMNFKKIISEMKKLGVKYYLVEQDNAALLPDTLEQVARSMKYLKGVNL